jgi:parallel beta-helix repeat protein
MSRLFVLFAVVILLAVPAPAAAASTIFVDNDPADGLCPRALPTIQAGVDAADPGDVVLVCPGVYSEEVTIAADDSDISVKARGPLGSVVVDGANTMLHGFELTGAEGVLLEGFVVQRYHDDILLEDADNNVIRGNETTAAWDHDGIQLTRNNHGNLIENNISHDNQRAISCGISVGGGSSDNIIRHNTVYRNANIGILLGGGLLGSAGTGNVVSQNVVFDNGEPVSGTSRGVGIVNAITAGSTIEHNHVFSNHAHGILVSGATSTGVTVAHNLVESNGSENDDDGIRIDTAAAVVQYNDSRLNRHDGVHLRGASGAVVTHNAVDGNGTPGVGNGCGIDVDSLTVAGVTTPSTGNTITHNVVRGHDRAGIRVRNSASNTVANNETMSNPGDGILLSNGDNNSVERNQSDRNGSAATHAGIHADSASSGNVLTANNMFGNTAFDARDDNRSANTWTDNRCDTDSPPGTICQT